MTKSLKLHRNNYGYIQLNRDGTIINTNDEVRRCPIFRKLEDSDNIFKQLKNEEVRMKLHQCFLGKLSQFIVTIDSQQYFFHFLSIAESITSHLYIFNLDELMMENGNNNWNAHLLTSIGELSAGVAHEVRNPLTAVKGFLQLLEQTYNTKYIHIALDEVERAISILNDLMSVSKPEFEQENVISFNVATELESTLLLFQNQLYNIRIVKDFKQQVAIVKGRRNQIKKAFFNLIKNAIEAMPNGGTLTIELYQDEDGTHVMISDTGVGIPKDKLRLLGTPFFTLKQDGTGMGIAQVYSAIQNNHAFIQVKSIEGKGTSFYIRFPNDSRRKDHTISMEGIEMKTVQAGTSLAEFLEKNADAYANEWHEYIERNKSYFFDFYEDPETLKETVRLLTLLVSKSINGIKSEEIIAWAKETGTNRAKVDFPINLAWEVFQSCRGILWSAIRTYYLEEGIKLDIEEFFALERNINDIIDTIIDTYTSYYVKYKDELLRCQRETVDELSVPVIPIANKVSILPIVGNVDTYRAKKIREKTLVRVKELKAQKLIIDISGVPFVDTAVVNHLFKIVKGIRLLGCSTILTGISPEIADTMIELGIEIDSELKTRSDLQQALQEIQL
ncbi:rsbT co-antagonist protein RsbR [Oikeobacillus pervagus]|uniref:histidine kinase n=1 Tax=Oikeobacillus pervagus TaxID=1325931 RepID=A0AAJ1T2S4_9BACI|nr:ATP-binding protein [Oikeobacillus pervagus]MDQ0216117.1 rsbT co-antagonist protein RsbR [Oikeobacillus pervagus]